MASETLCAAFWQHTVLRPGNKIFACARYKSPVQEFTGELTSVLHSDKYNKLRQDSIDGIPNPNCQKCYYEESLGKISHRDYLNSVYNTKIVDLKYLEIGFDNICNLTCDGCRGEFSSSWAIIENPNVEGKSNIRSISEITNVPSGIRRIELLGGEPLMTSRHKFFLKLIKNPTDVEIVYNTNGTFLLDEETISLLKQYKNVEFIISIDGYKELNEQVRSGSKWESILEFINQIKRLKFNALIHSVLHINNWFGIVELSNFVNDIGLPWRTNVLTYPTHLDIINLSWDQKMKFIALLENVSIPVHEKYSTSSKEYIIKHLNVSK